MRRPTGSDDSLIQAAAGGDSASFAELVRRHRPWVCRLLRVFTHDAEVAEDLAQEVFTRLHRRAASYASRGQFAPYLKQIALNAGRTYLKQTARVRFVSWEDVGECVSEDIVHEVLAQGVRAEVRAAIDALPADQRDALLFRFFAGLSVPEIAQRARCPEGTVKSRLHHGLRKIRSTLEETRKPDL